MFNVSLLLFFSFPLFSYRRWDFSHHFSVPQISLEYPCNIREKDDRDEELWKVTAVYIFQSYPKFIERYLFPVFTSPRFRVSIKISIRVYLSRRLIPRKRSQFVFRLRGEKNRRELFDCLRFSEWMTFKKKKEKRKKIQCGQESTYFSRVDHPPDF